MSVITTENLTKIYNSGTTAVTALDHVNFQVQPEEFVAVMGPSGCGKSTLLHLVGGLDHPTAGQVRINGNLLTDLDDDSLTELRRRQIGFIFQFYNLIPVLSAIENVEYVMLLQGVADQERRRRALAVLAEVGLTGLEHRRPGELSGGQQQRVAVARAIVAEPVLVLADEPTANLDSVTGAALMDLMRRLNETRGITFVFSTHDPMVMQRARRLVHLKDGRVVG